MAALHYLPSLGASRALACCLAVCLFLLKEKTTKDTQPSMKCCCQEAGNEKFPTPVGKFYMENYRNLCPIPWILLPSVRQLSLEKIKSKKRERKRSRSAVNTFQVHLTWFKSGRPHFCGDKSPGNSRWKDMCVCVYACVQYAAFWAYRRQGVVFCQCSLKEIFLLLFYFDLSLFGFLQIKRLGKT